MSNSSKFVANSIEQILLGLAKGLSDAQTVLNELPTTDAFGRPQSSYHLPYLDFDIKATVTATSTTETQAAASTSPTLRKNAKARAIPRLRLTLPDLKQDSSSTNSTQLVSTFSGRLISVPPGNTLPVPHLAARTVIEDPAKPDQPSLHVTLSNSAGELLDNMAIELNLDIDASLQLSSAAGAKGLTAEQLRNGLQLPMRILVTDQQGSASCPLNLDQSLPANTQILLLINSGPTLTQLIINT